jgi:hypothetical protein
MSNTNNITKLIVHFLGSQFIQFNQSNQPTNHPTIQPSCQPVNLSTCQPVNLSTCQPVKPVKPVNLPKWTSQTAQTNLPQ